MTGVRQEKGAEVLYHCDINQCKIVKTTLKGESLWAHGYPREDPAYARRPIDFVPTNVAFAPNGDFYVGDGYGSHHLLRFSSDGRFLGEVGRPATVTTNSTRHTASSWTPAVGFQSSWLQIVGTGAFKPFP